MRIPLTLAIASFVLVALGGDAAALDDRVYPGSQCVKWSGATPTYWYSSIENPSTSTMKVDCPAGNATNLAISDNYVWARDQNSGSNVVCNIVQFVPVNNANIGAVYTSGNAQTSGSSANFQFIAQGMAQHGGWLYWSCSVPAISGSNKSSIGAYNFKQI